MQAFGYLPIDTVLVPERGVAPLFDLVPDSMVEARIAVITARMEERAAPFFAVGFRAMNRERLLAFAGAHTMRSMVDFTAGPLFRNRIKGVLLDGKPLVDGREWSVTGDRLAELSFLLPEEMERTEFLSCGPKCVVMSIYTRDYMRDLLARQAQLPKCTVVPTLTLGLSAPFDPDPEPRVVC